MEARLPTCVFRSAAPTPPLTGDCGDAGAGPPPGPGACAHATPAPSSISAAAHPPRIHSNSGRGTTRSADDRIFLEKGKCGMVVTPDGDGGLGIELQRQLQVCGLVPRERHRIDAGIARRAVIRTSAANGARQAVETQVGDA